MPSRTEAQALADRARLTYTDDDLPGTRRVRRGRGFSYTDPQGSVVSDGEREWIESLAIPPAWREVWVSPVRDGHILATGIDEAGRKQYLYHPDWEAARDEVKFDQLEGFGHRLSPLRQAVDRDLRLPRLDHRKVVALAVAILDRSLIRIGNREYADQNESYGLTTLTCEHADVNGSLIRLAFAGKGGADNEVAFRDSRLASLVRECRDLDGQNLFSYETPDGPRAVGSCDVNDYLAGATGERFTAKVVRTWGATVEVVGALTEKAHDEPDEDRLVEAIDRAAAKLGNSRQICRDSYVHPLVPEAYADGRLYDAWKRARSGRWIERPESAVNGLLRRNGSRPE